VAGGTHNRFYRRPSTELSVAGKLFVLSVYFSCEPINRPAMGLEEDEV
jgi:hypothetical protein